MFPYLLILLVPCFAIFAQNSEKVLIEKMQTMQQKQFSELPSYQAKKKIYDSTKDPFFKDKDVESNTHTTQTIYFKKNIRQIIIQDREVLQLAPPSPRYIWHTEYFFQNSRLYYVNFRYQMKMQNMEEGTEDSVTEIIVFLPKNAPSIAFQKILSASRADEKVSFRLDKSFRKIDLDQADGSGMTTAVLKGGILEMNKGKGN